MKYLEDGRAVGVIGTANDGRPIVASVNGYKDAEDDDILDARHPMIVDRVYEEPPTEQYEAEIQDILQEIDRLRAREAEMSAQISNFQRHEAAFFEKCRKFPQLERLEQFLDGKITHYAVFRYNRVPEVATVVERAEGGADGIKLLSLFGDSKGNLNWKLNQYRDGSGYDTEVYPATSAEEALEIIREKVIEKAMSHARSLDWVIEAAVKYQIELDPEYKKRWTQHKLAAAQKMREVKARELEQAEAS